MWKRNFLNTVASMIKKITITKVLLQAKKKYYIKSLIMEWNIFYDFPAKVS